MRKIFALGAISIFVLVGVGRADIIPTFVSGTPDGNNTLWTYTINITADQNATINDFFTIYDFGSIVPGSNTQPADWTFSSLLTGVNPAQTNAPDDPNVFNLTWTYTGASAIPSGGPIGPFTIETAGALPPGVAPETHEGFFAAQGTLVTGPTAGSHVNNVGILSIPTAVPEASTGSLLIVTAALGGMGLAIRKRRNRRLPA
jgi:hypothetical protein